MPATNNPPPTTPASHCYVGLGSNLDQPELQLRAAILELAQLPHTRMLARSSLYRSAALGPGRQDDYINAVVKLDTSLTPWQLLNELQALERDHGRVRNQRWAPRTLDLDILLYGQLRIDEEKLCIPHAQMYQRNFVLCPLLEIEPDLIFPDHAHLADKLAACPAGRLVKLPEPSDNHAPSPGSAK